MTSLAIVVGQTTDWIGALLVVLGVATGCLAVLLVRSRPVALAAGCWVTLGACAGLGFLPVGVAALLALAVVAALLADRLPPGLAWALFAWLVTIAVAWALADAASTARRGVSLSKVLTGAAPLTPAARTFLLELISHTAAALSAWWMLAALLSRHREGQWASEARSALVMTAIVLGVTSITVLVYGATIVGIWLARWPAPFIQPPLYEYRTTWQGLIDIALVGLALALSRGVGRWPGRPVAGLWLTIFAGTWWGLMLPPGSDLVVSGWPSWLGFTLWLQTAWSWPVLAAVLLWVWRDWRAQERAWPERLDQLARVSRPWPGLEPSATAIGLALIPAGLWHAFATGSGAIYVTLLTTIDIVAISLALSILVGRWWNRNLAELSLALWCVALAALGAVPAATWGRSRTSVESLPAVHTGVMAGLALAGGLWYWLARVWHQQLDGTRGWTATGRMVPLAARMAFMATALATLIGAKLALWPQMHHGSADNSLARLLVGSLAYLLLLGVCLLGRPRRNPALVLLTLLVALTWVMFLWART